MKSKIISRLREYSKENNKNMFKDTIVKIKRKGTPLIEKTDNGYTITFIALGNDFNNISVVGSFPGFNIKKQKMNLINNTNFWYKTYEIERPINFTYGYVKDYDCYNGNHMDNIILDQYNTSSITIHRSEKESFNLSVVNMLKDREVDKYFKKNKKQDFVLKEKFIKNSTLDQRRRYWLLNNNKNKNYEGIILFTDGYTYSKDQELLNVFHYIRENQLIPNLLFVFVENLDRNKELTANSKFRDFIVNELYIKLKTVYNLKKVNDHNIICGKSLGGLNALYTSLTTDIFSKIISHSGTFVWNYRDNKDQDYLIKNLEKSNFVANDVYLDVGLLENDIVPDWNMSLIEVNKKVRELLKEKTNNIYFNIFDGGHDYYCWRKNTIKALLNFYN